MKKLLLIIVCLLAACPVLSACGNNARPTAPSGGKPIAAIYREGYTEEFKYGSSVVHRVKNGDMSIYGRVFRPLNFDENKKYPILIMSHGYQTISADQTNSLVRNAMDQGILCYTFDFCGGAPTTRSDGKFEDMTVMTEISDLKAVIEDIKTLPYVDTSRIALFGQSQGGLVTSVVIGEYYDSIRALILQAPAIMKAVEDGTDPVECLQKYPEHFMILWGSEDESVPVDLGYGLQEKFGDRLTFVLVEGAPHSLQPADYQKCMGDVNAYLQSRDMISGN
jgi:dienelactone hydrolase